MDLMKFEIAQAEMAYRRERAERTVVRRNGRTGLLGSVRRRTPKPVMGHQPSQHA